MIVEMAEIQDTSVTSGSLIDVPAEISHPISNPVSYTGNCRATHYCTYCLEEDLLCNLFCLSQEIPYVGAIPGGLKTDMAVVFQGAIPADSKEYYFILLIIYYIILLNLIQIGYKQWNFVLY